MTSDRTNPWAFTLLELLIATALSLTLAAVAVDTFVQVRAMARRREAIMSLARSAETLHLQLAQRLPQLAQECAVVVDASSVVRDGSAVPQPTLRFLYMRGKEVPGDWNSFFQGGSNNGSALAFHEATDLTWELWEYRPEQKTLYVANNSRARQFKIAKAFGTAGAPLQNTNFAILPKCRATLASPNWWLTLNDNCLFPSSGNPLVSDADSADQGDWMELQANLQPIATGISALAIAIVPFQDSGTPAVFTAGWDAGPPVSATSSGSVPSPLVLSGIRQDGAPRDAGGREPGATGWTWAATAAAQRPRLLRLRFTAGDAATGISQTYSFSFLLPGLAGAN